MSAIEEDHSPVTQDIAGSAALREVELWQEASFREYDEASLENLAGFLSAVGRGMPPFLEFYALQSKARAGSLSVEEAPRLLSLWERLGLPLAPTLELVLLERLLDNDPTDLRFLRRWRDLKTELGHELDATREELALRADLLLNPSNTPAARRLARLMTAEGKPLSLLLQEKSLYRDLEEYPGDGKISVILGTVLERLAKPIPAEIQEAALRSILQPGTDDGFRAVVLCKFLVARRCPVPGWLEVAAVRATLSNYDSPQPEAELRDLAAEYDLILSRLCSESRGDGILICNSMGKSGTHLASQFISALGGYRYSRLHCFNNIVAVDNSGLDVPITPNIMLIDPLVLLRRVAGGHFVTAHLPWSIQIEMSLRDDLKPPAKILLMHRDPRDILVSEMRFETYSSLFAEISDENRNTQERMKQLSCDIDRLTDVINRALDGRLCMPFLSYFGWLRCKGCLPVAFEDLYSDLCSLKNGFVGETVRNLSEFLGADLAAVNPQSLYHNVYGRGATFVEGDNKVAHHEEIFTRRHYQMIRGSEIETAIRVMGRSPSGLSKIAR